MRDVEESQRVNTDGTFTDSQKGEEDDQPGQLTDLGSSMKLQR